VGLACSHGILPRALEEEDLASLEMQWAQEEHGMMCCGREGSGE